MDHLTPASMYKVRVKVKTKGNKKNVIQSNWYQVNTTGLQGIILQRKDNYFFPLCLFHSKFITDLVIFFHKI